MNRMTFASVACALLLPFFSTVSSAEGKLTTPAQSTKGTIDPLKGLSRDHDKMRGITWYQSPKSPKHANSNGFYLYFGKDDSGQLLPLRLVARYYADDWLFVNRAWAKADGAEVNVPQKSKNILGWERDNSGGKIWEWSDTEVMTTQDIASVRKISEAKNVTIRFEGKQYYNDRTLTASQLKSLRDVIVAYETATGKPWK